jgi:FAD/FMN-containing dehydrogenase
VNQVVTVEPGRTLADLQADLAEHKQWLPIRPPLSRTCTLGGLVALDASGPDRLRYGAVRDALLGLKFVAGTGDRVSAGGRVVKNVAGYDLTRTLAGSLGTLGFLTELTLRTLPMPEGCQTVAATGELSAVCRAASKVLESSVEPTFLVAEPDGSSGWVLTIGFEGFKETIAYQVETCRSLLGQADVPPGPGSEYAPVGDFFADRHEALYAAPYLLRADLPRGKIEDFETRLRQALPGAKTLLDLGCGRLFAATDTLGADSWGALAREAAALNGYVRLEAAPDSFIAEHDVFGAPRPEWSLMHKIKQALDPDDLFAPGRLPSVNAT